MKKLLLLPVYLVIALLSILPLLLVDAGILYVLIRHTRQAVACLFAIPGTLVLGVTGLLALILFFKNCAALLQGDSIPMLIHDTGPIYLSLLKAGLPLVLGFWGWMWLAMALLSRLNSPMMFLFYLFPFIFYLRECFELSNCFFDIEQLYDLEPKEWQARVEKYGWKKRRYDLSLQQVQAGYNRYRHRPALFYQLMALARGTASLLLWLALTWLLFAVFNRLLLLLVPGDAGVKMTATPVVFLSFIPLFGSILGYLALDRWLEIFLIRKKWIFWQSEYK